MSYHPTHSRPCRGFTLVELLVSIGVIGVLIGILFPVLSSVRRRGRDITCISNMHEIATALISYASQNNGAFPTIASRTTDLWYSESIIGPFISAPDRVGRPGEIPDGAAPSAGLANGVFRCPNDLDDAVRSYSMNFFANGRVSSHFQKLLNGPKSPGRLFRLSSGPSSRLLLLLLESWPELPIDGTHPTVYAAQAVVGLVGKPGARFGGGAGLAWKTPVDATPGRFDTRKSQITFYRHDPRRHKLEAPTGRCNFAFLDGHVATLDQKELVRDDGTSTYVALWSQTDSEVEHPPTTTPTTQP